MHILENAHSPAPSKCQISPNCWLSISNTNICIQLHNFWLCINNTHIYSRKFTFPNTVSKGHKDIIKLSNIPQLLTEYIQYQYIQLTHIHQLLATNNTNVYSRKCRRPHRHPPTCIYSNCWPYINNTYYSTCIHSPPLPQA